MTLTSKTLSTLGYVARIGLVIVYLGWVVYGYFFLDGKRVDFGNLQIVKRIDFGNLQFTATRSLPAGYRVHSGDVGFRPNLSSRDERTLPPEWSPVNKYLANAHKTGDAFGTADLKLAPIINVSAGKSKYFFSLQNQKELSDVLNTDSRVDVCGVICPIENARIASIVCSENDSTSCFAVLELTQQQAQLISGSDKESYRLILRGD